MGHSLWPLLVCTTQSIYIRKISPSGGIMKKVQKICASSLVTKKEGRNTLMEGVREQLLQETEYARAEKRAFLTVNYMDLDLN